MTHPITPKPPAHLEDIETLTDRHKSQLWDLYRGEWWSADRTLQDTHDIIAGSSINFGIVDLTQDRLVAYSRVLTDYIRKALIYDVIVAPTHRGLHLGARQMDRILSHPKLARVAHFELGCKPDLVAFYERWDFSADLAGTNHMRLTRR